MITKKPGILYIVATPIGNLADMTLRAVETLQQVDCIAAEDTRHSSKLLTHYKIKKPLLSLHDYNENNRSELLIKRLQQGENIALISDAGTPLISDPGYKLVTKVRAIGIKVVPIPGACAAITALSAAGLPTDKFIFEGFLPAKTAARKSRLQELTTETRTLIFYESPHRLLAFIDDITEIFEPERQIVLARELTKKFETIHNCTIAELKPWLENDSKQQKGEFVILIHGAKIKKEEIDDAAMKILKILAAELPVKQAAALAAKITGISKNKLYDIAVSLITQ